MSGFRLDFQQSGGFGGMRMRATVDDTELSPDERDQVRTLFASRAGQPARPPRQPDRYQYRLTLAEDGAEQVVVLQEEEVGPELRPLLDHLTARATLA